MEPDKARLLVAVMLFAIACYMMVVQNSKKETTTETKMFSRCKKCGNSFERAVIIDAFVDPKNSSYPSCGDGKHEWEESKSGRLIEKAINEMTNL